MSSERCVVDPEATEGRALRISTLGKILLALLVVVLALRESGALDLNAYLSTSSSQIRNQITAASSSEEHSASGSNATDFESRVIVTGDASLTENVGETLRAALAADLRAEEGRLTVELTRTDLLGIYLLPIFKFADVEFECTYELQTHDGGILTSRNGNAEGTVDLVVQGVCSVRRFRGLAGALTAQAIEKQVRDVLRKK